MADIKGFKHTFVQEHGSVAGQAAGVAKAERGDGLPAPDDHNEAEDNDNTQHEPAVAAGLDAQQVGRGKGGSKLTKIDDLVKSGVNTKAKANSKSNDKPVEDEGTVLQLVLDHDGNKCPDDGFTTSSETKAMQ